MVAKTERGEEEVDGDGDGDDEKIDDGFVLQWKVESKLLKS